MMGAREILSLGAAASFLASSVLFALAVHTFVAQDVRGALDDLAGRRRREALAQEVPATSGIAVPHEASVGSHSEVAQGGDETLIGLERPGDDLGTVAYGKEGRKPVGVVEELLLLPDGEGAWI